MPTDEKKGVYIPESIWKIVQSLTIAALLGAYGMAWRHEAAISTLELVTAAQGKEIAELKAEVKEQDDALDSIKTSLELLTLGQVHTNEGITALKLALTR